MIHPIARILGIAETPAFAKHTAQVEMDEPLNAVCRSFDYAFSGISEFTPPEFPAPKRDGSWSIGVIVGPSGSGKSILLKEHYGVSSNPSWDARKAVVSQVSPEKLSSVGFNSVPSWCRPFHVLSNGEAFRAELARNLESNSSFDEFTSTIDRVVAKSCCVALSRFVRQSSLRGVVLATCHYDVLEWLDADWVFDTQTGRLSHKGCLRRGRISLEIFPCRASAWGLFRNHHYLTGDMNKSAKCYLAVWEDNPVGFVSALPFPNGNFKNGWREHRTVVLPDFQGLGIGVRISDFVAQIFTDKGCRYFSKTSHPRMGGYRESSPLWKATSKNNKARRDYSPEWKTKEDAHKMSHAHRVCFSHEYVGGAP